MSSCTVLLNTKHVAVEPGYLCVFYSVILTTSCLISILVLHISLFQFFEKQVYNTFSHQTSVRIARLTVLVTYLVLLNHIANAVTDSCNIYVYTSIKLLNYNGTLVSHSE